MNAVIPEMASVAAFSNAISTQLDKTVRRSLGARCFHIDNDKVQLFNWLRLNISCQQLDCLSVENFEAMIVADADRSYLEWMLTQDFLDDVRSLVRRALK